MLAHSSGVLTFPIYFQTMDFVETKPKQLPPYLNIISVYEKETWLTFLGALLAVSLNMSLITFIRQKYSKSRHDNVSYAI